MGKENFNKIVNFILSNGRSINKNGCEYQYDFFDSRGTRHAMIAYKRDWRDGPSKTGKVEAIYVWSYKNNIKDQKHFFGWSFTKDQVYPSVKNMDGSPWDPDGVIRKSYEEFLAKVIKEAKK